MTGYRQVSDSNIFQVAVSLFSIRSMKRSRDYVKLMTYLRHITNGKKVNYTYKKKE